MSSSGKSVSQSQTKGHRYHPFNGGTTTAQAVPESFQATGSDNNLNAASSLSDLDSSPLLDYLGYRFHKVHRVMICVSCECAIVATSAIAHANNQHNIKTTLDNKRSWQNTVLDWNVTSSTSIPAPHNRQPVELLKIHPKAFCCNQCTYAALSPLTFSKHWSMTHRSQIHIASADRYHHGYVQTFFPHISCQYFEVDPPTPTTSLLFDVYKKKEVPTYPSFNLTIPSAPREIPPLLYQTRWHEHLADYIKEPAKRRILMPLAHPKQYTKCPLWKLVWNYIAAIADIAKHSSMRVRCLLTEYPR